MQRLFAAFVALALLFAALPISVLYANEATAAQSAEGSQTPEENETETEIEAIIRSHDVPIRAVFSATHVFSAQPLEAVREKLEEPPKR